MDNPVYAMLQAEDSQRLLEGSSEGGASDETSHQKREEEYPGTVFGHGKESSIVQVDSKIRTAPALSSMTIDRIRSETVISERSVEGGRSEASAISSNGHCHDDHINDATERRAEKVLWMVAALSVVFIAIEGVGGALANSLAIITDAGHLLSDLLSFVISIVAIRTARHPANRRLSFGYHRAEILGATISIIILWVLTTVLVLLAIERIAENKMEVDANTMLITAGAGVLFNIIMAAVLQFGSGSHAHSHSGLSHGHSPPNHNADSEMASEVINTRRNVNVRAAFVHVIGDLVQSIGVLVAALVIKFTGWQYADPICTFFFSIIVLITTISVLRDILYVLMEATPPHINYAAIHSDLLQLQNVAGVHDLHVWSLNMEKTALSVHLAIESAEQAVETVAEARLLILRRYSLHHVTIQVEPFDTSMTSCEKCLEP